MRWCHAQPTKVDSSACASSITWDCWTLFAGWVREYENLSNVTARSALAQNAVKHVLDVMQPFNKCIALAAER
jgi:hypothetical protein